MPANNQNKRAVYLLETDETGDYQETVRGGIYSTTTKAAKAIAEVINENLKEISLLDAKVIIDSTKSETDWNVMARAYEPHTTTLTTKIEPATAKTVCGDNMGDGWDSLGRDDFSIKWTDSNRPYENSEGLIPMVRFKTIAIKWQSVKRVLDTLEVGEYLSNGFHFGFEESDYTAIENGCGMDIIDCASIQVEELQ